MELRHLRYVLAVADTRNFTRAAQQLGVSQPPLSRQIRDLEQELGAPFFLRDTRPVVLTEAGKLLAEHARQILAHVDQLERDMRRLSCPRFVIGVVGSILQGAMPEMIRRFREASPQTEVELIEMTTIQQVAALKEGRIDAGLGRIRVGDADIARTLLYAEPLALACPAGPWAGRGEASLQDLEGQVLILYPSSPRPSYADQVLTMLADQGVKPGRLIEVREVQTALGLVAAEAGMAIVPESLSHSHRRDIAFLPLADEAARSPILLSQRRSDKSDLAATFRAIGQSVFA